MKNFKFAQILATTMIKTNTASEVAAELLEIFSKKGLTFSMCKKIARLAEYHEKA